MCRKWADITKLFWKPKKEYNKPIQEIEKPKGTFVTIEKESVSKKDLIRLVEKKEKDWRSMRIISMIEISEKIENLKPKSEHLEDRNSELLEEKTKLKKSLKERKQHIDGFKPKYHCYS